MAAVSKSLRRAYEKGNRELVMIKPRQKSKTIKDIAIYLNISHSTVSRALNDHPQVSDATKERVRNAAKDFGYIPNLSARMIRGDYQKIIGLVVPDIRNDFYSRMARELGACCRAKGMRMLLAITEDDAKIEEDELRGLVEARVCGVVAALTNKPSAASQALLQNAPLVQLVRRNAKMDVATVCMDDSQGCFVATEHLLDLGHTNIAYVGTRDWISTGKDRLSGYTKALKGRGLVPDAKSIVLVPPRQEYGYDALSRIVALENRPTAVLIGSSELTVGALQAIREANLAVPEDISIVGYGDPVWFELLRPALTAVSLPVEGLAEAAMNELIVQIDLDKEGGGSRRSKVIRVSPTLRVRDSTAFHRTEGHS